LRVQQKAKLRKAFVEHYNLRYFMAEDETSFHWTFCQQYLRLDLQIILSIFILDLHGLGRTSPGEDWSQTSD